MIRLALLRHGVTPWNAEGRIQGATDIPLAEDSRRALSSLRLPKPWDAADVVSSPLARARQTAEALTNRAPALDPALTEMDWGAWEGQHGADLLADPDSGYCHIEDWGWHFRPPGGETPAELWDRLRPWLAGLSRDTLCVCHIGVMRVLLARATGWQFDGPAPFRVKRNRLYLLDADPSGGEVTLTLHPDTPRLEPR